MVAAVDAVPAAPLVGLVAGAVDSLSADERVAFYRELAFDEASRVSDLRKEIVGLATITNAALVEYAHLWWSAFEDLWVKITLSACAEVLLARRERETAACVAMVMQARDDAAQWRRDCYQACDERARLATMLDGALHEIERLKKSGAR